MEYIKKVTSYNSPIEKSSNDRFIEDVDNKLNKYKVADIDLENFSYIVTSTTEAEFTINGKRANYLRIESDIFETKKVSYWFLTSVSEIESDTGTRYNAKLDVMATFGVDVFNQLDGKEVNIKRVHGERYEVTDIDENRKLLKHKADYKGLLSNDFHAQNVLGERVESLDTDVSYNVFQYEETPTTDTENKGADVLENTYYQSIRNFTSAGTESGSARIRNWDSRKAWTLRFTAELSVIGYRGEDSMSLSFNYDPSDKSPQTKTVTSSFQNKFTITLNTNGTIHFSIEPHSYQSWRVTSLSGYYKVYKNLSLLTDTVYYKKSEITIDENLTGHKSTMITFKTASDGTPSNITKNIVDNVIIKNKKIYYAYALVQASIIPDSVKVQPDRILGSDVLIAPVDVIRKEGTNSLKEFQKIQNNGVVNIFISPHYIDFEETLYEFINADSTKRFDYKYTGLNLKDAKADLPDVIVGVSPHKLTLENVSDNETKLSYNVNELTLGDRDFVVNYELLKTKGFKIDAVDKPKFRNDIGALSNFDFILNTPTKQIKMDMGTWKLNDSMVIKFLMNEMGINQRVEISDNQFAEINEQNYLTFTTNQASSYLQTNKNSIEAQKKLIELQRISSINSAKSQQAGAFGGGIVGGLLSALNPATYAGVAYAGKQVGVANDVAKAKKQEIQANIDDLKNTVNIIHEGSENSASIYQEKGKNNNTKWHIDIIYPNENLMSKIINYNFRYGVLVNSFSKFTAVDWKGRETFNYLSVIDVEDELSVTNDIDISVIKEIQDELGAGIRIWHSNDIDYSLDNNEVSLLNYFN